MNHEKIRFAWTSSSFLQKKFEKSPPQTLLLSLMAHIEILMDVSNTRSLCWHFVQRSKIPIQFQWSITRVSNFVEKLWPIIWTVVMTREKKIKPEKRVWLSYNWRESTMRKDANVWKNVYRIASISILICLCSFYFYTSNWNSSSIFFANIDYRLTKVVLKIIWIHITL